MSASKATKFRVDKALLSEDALALRFSEEHKDSLRYVSLQNQWFGWDGTRWRPEGTLLAFDLARRSVRTFVDDCGGEARYKQAKVVAAIERLARADRRQACELADFDTNPMLFNCVNGTINLETGELQKHDPGDYITKRAACELAPADTPHPLWSAFLHRIFDGNVELIQ
jgi:putative DNA primase/helicase